GASAVPALGERRLQLFVALAGPVLGGAGTDKRPRLADLERLVAAPADPAVVDDAAAPLVDDDHRRTLGPGEMAVSPLKQRDHRRPKGEALFGQEVLVAGGTLLVGPALEDAGLGEVRQPTRENV